MLKHLFMLREKIKLYKSAGKGTCILPVKIVSKKGLVKFYGRGGRGEAGMASAI
jgi:hypothetical protein